ncbi:transketolase [Haploplasma axanthum]|uniref:Transketolase n=1 Tax=Haploplasma axanthum TaxID=29552 RepID=A0A449BBC8_HAPAX|nr:transketolase [Haploplasma axanthum]VEU79649.1 Transketolase [Haploplasma axanthum]
MIQEKAINAIRFLGVDAINEANSGHPGIVLGAAPMAEALFANHVRVDVKAPHWINRDRFILSAGHGSAMLYAINHLIGYNITIENLKNFRKIGNTPGHPEYGHTEGVETTSGPLGQGISNAVGMAIAEAHLSARFNKPGFNVVDHFTYTIVGDGDLQEGVALEAISLAGHLGLGKLIVLFDSNDIQLDGPVSLAYSEKHRGKFEAQNWHYTFIEDGMNADAINKAIIEAKKVTDKPSIIEIKTTIGFGATKAGTSSVHGSPLGADVANLRKNLNWNNEPFVIDQDVYDFYHENVTKRGLNAHQEWNKLYAEYSEKYPEDAKLFETFIKNDLKIELNEFDKLDQTKPSATRNVSGNVLSVLSSKYLNLIGGSADLTSSTKAKGADGNFEANNHLGRNINYGVREHAMGAIANGITLHGGLKSFTGAFFVFSDYMKPAIRLAAIMNIPTIFVFSHDSIAVGEDGPTHQPIEQLVGLRAIPNLNVIRPADTNETVAAWKIAVESKNTPTTIILTRQNVENYPTTNYDGVTKGAYIVGKENEKLDGVLLAAGSEVELAMKTKELLLKENIDVRVVSMPSSFLFDKQSEEYKNNVLPKGVKTVAIEMASPMSWYKYTPNVYGIETFGLSDNGDKVVEVMGFTPNKVKEFYKNLK